VGSYYYLHEADIARSLLDSYGIESWILDEHQIRQRWHLAGALGGVKVAVAPEKAYRARQILSEDYSDVLEDIPEAELPAHPDECCPRCGGIATRSVERRAWPTLIGWITSLFWLAFEVLAPRRRVDVQRICNACGHRWHRTETR